MKKIIEELQKRLTEDCTYFNIFDNNGNEVKSELEILNLKIDAIVSFEVKDRNYKVSKIKKIYPIQNKRIYYAEICEIEIFINDSSEFIFVYAELKDNEDNTTSVKSWKISQDRY